MAALTLARRYFGHLTRIQVRNYLSSGYLCEKEWSESVINDPLISKSNQESLLNELIRRYNAKLKVGAIDVDVFAHLIKNTSQLTELEHILQLFRKTRRAVDILDSTHHAVCRAYIEVNSHNQLLDLLEKRVEFGIFPDDYIYNALMDHYLMKNDVKRAFRVATLYMLQERYNNEIARSLALLSAYKWLTRDAKAIQEEEEEAGAKKESTEDAKEAAAAEEQEEDEDEDEVKYVRVPFLRNAYNDGHFDLTDQNVICGKIFHYIGMRTSNPLGVNMQILGLSLSGDWKSIATVLANNKTPGSSFIAKDLLDVISSKVTEECKEEYSKVENTIRPLPKLDVTTQDLLNECVSNISKLQAKEQEELIKRMKSWTEDRQLALDSHLHELTRDQLIIDIKKKRRELKEKEKLLYFFENVDKIELELQEAEKANATLKTKAEVEEEYIPPKFTSGGASRNKKLL